MINLWALILIVMPIISMSTVNVMMSFLQTGSEAFEPNSNSCEEGGPRVSTYVSL